MCYFWDRTLNFQNITHQTSFPFCHVSCKDQDSTCSVHLFIRVSLPLQQITTKLVALSNTNLYSYSSPGQKFKMSITRLKSRCLETLGKNSFPCLFQHLWLHFLTSSFFSLRLCFPLLLSHGLLFSCQESNLPFPPPMRIFVITVRAHLNNPIISPSQDP